MLVTDSKWIKFIKKCEELGVCCGAPLVFRTKNVTDEVTKRLNRVKLFDGHVKSQNR